MTTAPESSPRQGIRRILTDNPAVVLSFVFVAIFATTDLINRAQNVILKQHKGPRDGEINQVFTLALARVDEGRQSPDAAWKQALRESDQAANTRKSG